MMFGLRETPRVESPLTTSLCGPAHCMKPSLPRMQRSPDGASVSCQPFFTRENVLSETRLGSDFNRVLMNKVEVSVASLAGREST